MVPTKQKAESRNLNRKAEAESALGGVILFDRNPLY